MPICCWNTLLYVYIIFYSMCTVGICTCIHNVCMSVNLVCVHVQYIHTCMSLSLSPQTDLDLVTRGLNMAKVTQRRTEKVVPGTLPHALCCVCIAGFHFGGDLRWAFAPLDFGKVNTYTLPTLATFSVCIAAHSNHYIHRALRDCIQQSLHT